MRAGMDEGETGAYEQTQLVAYMLLEYQVSTTTPRSITSTAALRTSA